MGVMQICLYDTVDCFHGANPGLGDIRWKFVSLCHLSEHHWDLSHIQII